MRKIILTGLSGACLLLVALPVVAQAQPATAPGSNMPPDFYPHASCVKPDQKAVGGSPGFQDEGAMRSYNLKIKMFNDRAAAFNACIKRYVDNAQNDIGTIQATVHAAVTEANTRP